MVEPLNGQGSVGNLEAVNRLRREHGQPVLRDPSIPRRLSIQQRISQLTHDQRLAGVHTPFTYGSISKTDEVKVPEVQAMILDPDTRAEELLDYFTNQGHHPDIHAFPKEFDFYQLLRILQPEIFERSTHNDMLDRNGAYFWGNYNLDLELHGHDPEYVERRHPGIYKKLEQIRPAILKLNELLVQGQDPSEFDWEHLNVPQEPLPKV